MRHPLSLLLLPTPGHSLLVISAFEELSFLQVAKMETAFSADPWNSVTNLISSHSQLFPETRF